MKNSEKNSRRSSEGRPPESGSRLKADEPSTKPNDRQERRLHRDLRLLDVEEHVKHALDHVRQARFAVNEVHRLYIDAGAGAVDEDGLNEYINAVQSLHLAEFELDTALPTLQTVRPGARERVEASRLTEAHHAYVGAREAAQ